MGFLTAGIVRTALEVGLIYSLVALSLFMSFSILNVCDLSTDGCYTLGRAVGAVATIAGHPLLAIPLAMGAGVCSGFVTATLQTRFGVQSILAGTLEKNLADEPLAWTYTMAIVAAVFILIFIYHAVALPRVEQTGTRSTAKASQFLLTFKEFFTKPGVWIAIVFMLLYRFPEALLTKIAPLFLIDDAEAGGMALSTEAVGIAQGTVGVIGLTLGGILGGIADRKSVV